MLHHIRPADAAYFAELRRRANDNLSKGGRERRAREVREREAAKEAVKAERATQRAHAAHLRAERDDLRANLRCVPDMIRDAKAGDLGSSDPTHIQGCLEEIESMREQWEYRLERVLSDLRRAAR
jgi:hypothetical protein